MLRFSWLAVLAAIVFVPAANAAERHRSSIATGPSFVVAQATPDKAQKHAFEAAKELGTVEAWDAFLSNYPEGFYADLARAYVKRLAETPRTTQPAKPAPPQAAAPPPAPPSGPPLPTLELGSDGSSWKTGPRTVRIPGPIFNHQFQSAYVQSHGLELVTFCLDPSTTGGGHHIGMYVQETPGGGFPKFPERLQQGLAKKPNWSGTDFKVIDVTYSNGEAMAGATARPGLANGQWVFGPNGQTVGVRSDDLENLMATNSVTISAPPLVATFQLKGSRNAICEVTNACGAPVPGCVKRHHVSVDRDSGQDAPQNCGRGRTWVGAQGKCVCVNDNSYWNGSRCIRRKPRQTACTGGRTRDPQTGRCGCNGDSAWNGRACVVPQRQQAACTGGRTRDPQTGQCGCNGDSAWNGRACVVPNQPASNNAQNNNAQVRQAVCGTLQIACSLGQKGACAKFNANGCR